MDWINSDHAAKFFVSFVPAWTVILLWNSIKNGINTVNVNSIRFGKISPTSEELGQNCVEFQRTQFQNEIIGQKW